MSKAAKIRSNPTTVAEDDLVVTSEATLTAVAINAVLIAVRQAADVLCDRWTLITLLFAHAGVSRFADFRDRSGISNRELTRRLQTLEQQEILIRLPYQRRPLRHSYHLTHMGAQLFDVFAIMLRWERDWRPVRASVLNVVIAHARCSASPVMPQLKCAYCGDEVLARGMSQLLVNQKAIQQLPNKEQHYRRSTASIAGSSADTRSPLPRILEIFGDKWTIEIIVAAFMRVRQFGAFQAQLGISANILSDRCSRLVHLGILRQAALASDGRSGVYLLTDKGLALYPILLVIQSWADRWLRDRIRSPLLLTHRSCGQALHFQIHCDRCGQALDRSGAQLTIN